MSLVCDSRPVQFAARAVLLVGWVAGCGQAAAPQLSVPQLERLEGSALGTTWHLSWVRTGPARPGLAARVDRVLAEVDAQMSSWRDDSELAAVRRGPGPVEVSSETAAVVRAALALAERTGGAFDPTVEPLLELWGFRGNPLTERPALEDLVAARAQVDWRRVTVGEGPTVDAGGTALDLSAIAKGFAVDQVSAALATEGIDRHMVEIGGEVVARGERPGGGPWRLGIEAPVATVAPGSALVGTVALEDAAMATSGNYRNRQLVDGSWVVHTMDPRTGEPHDSDVLSATVVAPDCMTADGWATALMVLGVGGLESVEDQPGLEALLLVADGASWHRVATEGMPAEP